MPRVAVQRIEKGAGWSLEPKKYEAALRRAMESEAKPEVLKMMREVVEGKSYSDKPWKHKVDFKARFAMKGQDAVLWAYPTGPNKDLWTWTSRGTKPHGIDARNAPYLVFPYGGPGQQPKTRPRLGAGKTVIKLGGPGVTQWARVKHVDHPGTAPRQFEERIMDEYAPKFRKLVRTTIERVVQEKNAPYVGGFGVRR